MKQVLLKNTMSQHPASARGKDDLLPAYLRMKREGYRHLPVIDDHGHLVGIISDRDFQRAILPEAVVDAHGLSTGPNFARDAKVREYMSSPVESLPEETQLLTAVNLIIEKKISAVVITREGRITGIVTCEDLMRVLAALLKKPDGVKEKLFALEFNATLSQLSQALGTAGI
jgi:CBS domain-containing protein